MKQINLLPQYIQNRSNQKLTYVLVIISSIIGLLIVGGIWYFWDREKKISDSDLLQITIQSKEFLSQTQKNQLYTKTSLPDMQAINKITQLNILSSIEIDWTKVFRSVAGFIPKDFQLNALSYAINSDGLVAKISGTAPSNISFATFVDYLHTSIPVLKSSSIDSYNYSPKDGIVTFSATFNLISSQFYYDSAK